MEYVLLTREVIVKFFKRFEAFILPILKFFLGYFIFVSINSIGHMHEAIVPFTEILNPAMVNVLFALLFTVMPMNMGWLLIILSVTAQVSANIEVAVAVFLFMLFVFVFYVRMAPKESILILFTILAFHFDIPYLLPLVVGLYLPVTSIIPITVGVFINAQIPVMFGILAPGPLTTNIGDMEIADLLTELPEAFGVVQETLMRTLQGTEGWLFIAVIFAMVILLVHFVSRLAIDYSKEIAIALGCVMNIFGLIIAVMMTDANVNIGRTIVFTILSGLIALLIRLFDSILDYQRAESVQFEDDNNYYHVRIVPKIMMTKSKRVVKRIRPQTEEMPPVKQETTRRPIPRPDGARPDSTRPEPPRRPRPEAAGQETARRQPVRREIPKFDPPKPSGPVTFETELQETPLYKTPEPAATPAVDFNDEIKE